MKFDRYMGRHYDVQVLDHFTVSAQLSSNAAADAVESLALDIFSNPLPEALQLIEQLPESYRQDFYEAAFLIESGCADEAIQALRNRASFLASLAFDARVWSCTYQSLLFRNTMQKNDAKDDTSKLTQLIIRHSLDDLQQQPAEIYLLPCLLSPNAPNAAAASIMRNAA